MTRGRALALWLALCGCGPAQVPLGRTWSTVLHGQESLTRLRLRVPEGARCLALQVTGSSTARYRLVSLQVSGQEISAQGLAAERRGALAFVYPFAPGQPPPRGEVTVTLAADQALRGARLAILAPPDDGARVLRVNLVVVTDGAPREVMAEEALAVARGVLAQAGIALRVERRAVLAGGPLLGDGWEEPGEDAARLAAQAAARLPGGAVNVFVVDRLPLGSEGTSLSVPALFDGGAGVAGGVLLARAAPRPLGRALAHELAHALGLRHPRAVGPDGSVHEDGLGDPRPGDDNLMARGARLSAAQIFVLRSSPLLRRD